MWKRWIAAVLGMGLWALGLCGCADSAAKTSADRIRAAQDVQRDTARAQRDNERGVKALAEGKLDEAQKAFAAAVGADPMFGPAHNNLGKVHFARKELYQAAEEFEYAGILMPNRPEPDNNLGLVYEAAGKLEKAIEFYGKAVAMEPDNAELLGNLCRARVRRGDKDATLREQLRQLLLKDLRPQWVNWARERLALLEGRESH